MSEMELPHVYWHRELPPADAEMLGEYVVEADSARVIGVPGRGSDLWDRAYRDLMDTTRIRLRQEIARLGGDYAHVLHEEVDTRRDDSAGEAWLHGLFSYMLYRRPLSAGRVHT